jgi:ABC-type branched-subunit amino acid transport system ATPase component
VEAEGLVVENISVRYGGHVAVDSFNLTARSGVSPV